MERRGFIEGHAGDALRSSKRDVQRDGTAVGVADQMNLALALINERDRLFSFIGKRKGMLTRPLPPVLAAIVLGRQQLIAAAEGLGEVAPLASTSTGAMQGDYAPAAHGPRRGQHIDHGYYAFRDSGRFRIRRSRRDHAADRQDLPPLPRSASATTRCPAIRGRSAMSGV